MQTNYIPQGAPNPAQMMMQFQKFRQDFIAQNGPNADAEGAVKNILYNRGINQQEFISNGANLYNMMNR